MKKQFTIEEIAKHLQAHECVGLEQNWGEEILVYYLRINEDGELLCESDLRTPYDIDFESKVFNYEEVICEELGIEVGEDEDEDKYTDILELDDIYRAEDMKYKHFRDVVEDLTEQVNKWLAEQGEEITKMTRFTVEFLVENGIWDNIIGDYIEAENEEEAIELAIQWCIDNGMEQEEAESYEIRATICKWYAILDDEEDNDWDTGSYDYAEAERMARDRGSYAIAVINENNDNPVCEEIIEL